MYASLHPNGSIKQPKLVVDMTHGTLRSLMPEYLTNKSVNGIWNEFGFQGVSVPEGILPLGYVKLMSLWCLRKRPLILIHFFLERFSHFSLRSLGHPSNSTRWTFAWGRQDETSLMNSCHFHLASSAEFSCGSYVRQFVCQGRFIPTYRVLFLDIDGLVGFCVKGQMENRFGVGFGVNNFSADW